MEVEGGRGEGGRGKREGGWGREREGGIIILWTRKLTSYESFFLDDGNTK